MLYTFHFTNHFPLNDANVDDQAARPSCSVNRTKDQNFFFLNGIFLSVFSEM